MYRTVVYSLHRSRKLTQIPRRVATNKSLGAFRGSRGLFSTASLPDGSTPLSSNPHSHRLFFLLCLFLPFLSPLSPLTQCVSLSSSPLGIYPLIIIIAGTIDHHRGSPSRCAAAIFITGIRSCRPHLLTYMLHPPYIQLTSCQPGNYQVMCCS